MTLLSSARMSAAILALGALTAVPAHAAGIDGSSLGLTWAVPFAGILSIVPAAFLAQKFRQSCGVLGALLCRTALRRPRLFRGY